MSALKNFNRDYLQHLPNRDKLATKLAVSAWICFLALVLRIERL